MKHTLLATTMFIFMGICVIGSAVALTTSQNIEVDAAQIKEPFDHSNCQYPTRWSNPVDGCDNSDPAVPECVGKFTTQAEEQQCIADYIKAHTQPEPEIIVPPAPAPVEQPANQCK